MFALGNGCKGVLEIERLVSPRQACSFQICQTVQRVPLDLPHIYQYPSPSNDPVCYLLGNLLYNGAKHWKLLPWVLKLPFYLDCLVFMLANGYQYYVRLYKLLGLIPLHYTCWVRSCQVWATLSISKLSPFPGAAL